MGRGRIEIKKIENVSSRQVTFSKRRMGLIKKAKELSVLCDSQIGVIIFSSTGKLYEFSSSSMNRIISRYKRVPNTLELPCIEQAMTTENSQSEVIALKEELTRLRSFCLRMQGKGLEGLTFEELEQLEDQLHHGVLSIKNKKERMLVEQIEKAKFQEQKAITENEILRKEVEELRQSMKIGRCEGESNMNNNGSKRLRFSDHLPHSIQFLSLGLATVATSSDDDKAPKAESASHDSTSQMASG